MQMSPASPANVHRYPMDCGTATYDASNGITACISAARHHDDKREARISYFFRVSSYRVFERTYSTGQRAACSTAARVDSASVLMSLRPLYRLP